MPKLINTLAAAAISAIAAGVVWVIRNPTVVNRVIGAVAETAAFLLVAHLVMVVAGPIWALIPTAVWLLLHSVSFSRRAGSR